jgi:hypothetical protein
MSEQSKDGWIEWNGGECPVDLETEVEIRALVEGRPYNRTGSDTAVWFEHLGWWQGTDRVRIIAYRPGRNALARDGDGGTK